MALQNDSSIGAPTFLDIMYQQGTIKYNAFTFCLGEKGGVLTLGGEGPYKRGRYAYTPLLPPEEETYAYLVGVSSVYVEHERIDVDRNIYSPALIDSGTNSLGKICNF